MTEVETERERGRFAFDADYVESVQLGDGTGAQVRAVRAEDKPLLLEGLQHMSAESRYHRFFTLRDSLTKAELAYLTELDGVNHFAIGAVRQEGDRVIPLGVARFVRSSPDADWAEPAIAIVDNLHGRGLGRTLFVRLAGAALERGVVRFRCPVLAGNHAMLDFMADLFPTATFETEGSVVNVDCDLREMREDALEWVADHVDAVCLRSEEGVKQPSYAHVRRLVGRAFEAALVATRAALVEVGLQILGETDVRAAFAIVGRPYRILSVGDPELVARALIADPHAGLLMPCHVVVQEVDDGGAVVSTVDPMALFRSWTDIKVRGVARHLDDRLLRALKRLAAPPAPEVSP
jgi:acetyltransferase